MMPNSGLLKLTTRGDREVVMTRTFDAPRQLVWDCLTKPDLVRRWLLGPPGWTMPVCQIDLRVGGAFRYLWRHTDGTEMGMGGVYREIAAPARLIATERFDQPWYPGGDAVGTILLAEKDGRTDLTQSVEYPSAESRAIALKTPMADGVAMSYDALARLLAEVGATKGG